MTSRCRRAVRLEHVRHQNSKQGKKALDDNFRTPIVTVYYVDSLFGIASWSPDKDLGVRQRLYRLQVCNSSGMAAFSFS